MKSTCMSCNEHLSAEAATSAPRRAAASESIFPAATFVVTVLSVYDETTT